MKKTFSLLLFLFCSLFLCAEKFEYNHLYYNTLSDCTAEVSSQASLNYNHDSLVIRQTVDYRTNAYRIVRIGEAAFYEYPSLVFISLPNSVTSIGMGAFYNCTNLSKILLPPALQTIGCGAFANCTSLKEVTCLATVPPTREEMLPNAPTDEIFYGVDVANIPLYVPAESIELYKNADQWKDFGQILPIDDFNKSLVGEWKCIDKEDITVSISDSIICNNIFNQSNRYTASASQLYLERLWTFDDAPHRWEACDYSLKGDTLWIDKFWMGTMWVNIYPPILYDIALVRVKDTIDPKELFPTLWGLQRTTCLKNINENEVGTVWGSNSYLMQEIETTTIDGKQYLLFGTNNTYDEYCSLWLREENNKILVYSAAQKKDLVLYDFTLNVGDSLPRLYVDEELSSIVDYFKYEADWEYTKPLFVTEVSTITLLDGKEYKKWTFDNGMEYVEEIGSFGTSYAWNDFYQLIANGPLYSDVFSQHLVCASKNGQLLYKMDDAEMEQLETECLCEIEPKWSETWCDTWNVLSHGWDPEGGDDPYMPYTFIYQLEEDTTINDLTYQRLTGRFSLSTMPSNKEYVAALRFAENKKVFVHYDNTEYLLYDFGAQVGDTLEIFGGIDYYKDFKTLPHVITEIDTLDDGKLQIYSNAIIQESEGYETPFERLYPKIWIEGVGSKDGIVQNSSTNRIGIGPCVLLCAYHNDDCIYTTDNPYYTSLGCVYNDPIFSATEEVKLFTPSAQKIMHNGQLFILRDSKTYNVMGMEVK